MVSSTCLFQPYGTGAADQIHPGYVCVRQCLSLRLALDSVSPVKQMSSLADVGCI